MTHRVEGRVRKEFNEMRDSDSWVKPVSGDFEGHDIIKTGIFDRPTKKVHLGQAWRIEFPYRNIREEWMWIKGRAREAASRARPFVHIHSSRIFLYGNSILHACWVCRPRVDLALEIVGRPNIPVLILRVAAKLILSKVNYFSAVCCTSVTF